MLKVVGFWSLGIASLLLLAAGLIWPAVELWNASPIALATGVISIALAWMTAFAIARPEVLNRARRGPDEDCPEDLLDPDLRRKLRLSRASRRGGRFETQMREFSQEARSSGREQARSPSRGAETPPGPPPEPPRKPAPASPAPEVRLGISAPAGARPGEGRPVYFFATAAELEEEVQRKVRALDPSAKLHADLARTRWRVGLKVSVRLAGEHIEVDRPSQEFEWNGAFQILPFGLRVARDAPPGPTLLVVDVLVDGVVVAPIAVAFQVLAPLEEDRTESRTTWVRPARSAFASYSSEDRARVLDRVAVLVEGAGMDVAIDCLSLRPGERFKPQLADEIRDRELFLLYWSEAASHSEWVEWEWRQALDQKDAEDFILRPLDPLQLTELPEELSDLHAQSPIMLVRYADEILRRRRGPRAAPGRPSQVDQPAADGP